MHHVLHNEYHVIQCIILRHNYYEYHYSPYKIGFSKYHAGVRPETND